MSLPNKHSSPHLLNNRVVVLLIIHTGQSLGRWLAVVKKPRRNLWKGLFSLLDLVGLLREYLPPTFEELLVPLAVQVQDSDGKLG